jgi:hypothetical protein
MEFAETPEWEISLAWRQKVAAYWSISWPAVLASLVPALWTVSWLNPPALALLGNVVFYIIQGALVPRLVHKNYRSFRIAVIGDEGVPRRKLSISEGLKIWLWVLAPQLAVVLAALMLFTLMAGKIPAETIRGMNALWPWLRFLVIGPYALDLACKAKYRGFRLQAYGHRYI